MPKKGCSTLGRRVNACRRGQVHERPGSVNGRPHLLDKNRPRPWIVFSEVHRGTKRLNQMSTEIYVRFVADGMAGERLEVGRGRRLARELAERRRWPPFGWR